jgi:hypothetical protein
MKLRIRGSTIRLRLTQGEVARVASEGRVEDAIVFAPGEKLVYALALGEGPSLRARYAPGRIDVTAPRAAAREWADSDRVGMEGEQPIEGGVALKILVEKDFACLKPRSDDDDADAFPNPNDTC